MREAWIVAPWTVKLALIPLLGTVAAGAMASLFTDPVNPTAPNPVTR